MSDEPEPDDELFTCWCGVTGKLHEMFDWSEGCGGSGYIQCECGGDGLCVCHHHGEYECPGCDECEDERDYELDYDWSDDDE